MSDGLNLYNFYFIGKKELINLQIFGFGFLLYTLSYTLVKTTQVNYVICQSFQTLGILLFTIGGFSLIRFQFDNNYLHWVYSCYLFWLITVILRGISFDYSSIKIMLYDAWFGILIYFAPLILLFPKKLIYYKKAFELIMLLGIFLLVFDVLFINTLITGDLKDLTSQSTVEYFTRALSVPFGFLWLTYYYQSKKRKLFLLFITILTLFFVIVRARRALILITISPVLIAFIIYIVKSKSKIMLISICTFISIILLIYGKMFFQIKLFDSVRERGFEDTRSSVEQAFYKDMTRIDWIIGRGINGVYYCPGIDPGPSPYRETIETDYLQIILKSGLIGLTLILLITVPACILGIFYSKNMLTRASGIWILLWLICLYPLNVNNFSLSYLLVWMSVSNCYSKTIRNIPDDIIKTFFLSKSQA